MGDHNFAYKMVSDKSFEEVVGNINKLVPEHKFRVLAEHNVQQTLAEKGLERGPLKIIEVCNAGFAHKATQKDIDVALMMPCKYTVYEENGKTTVALMLPSVIAQMMPDVGLEELAGDVEMTLKTIMEASV